MPLQSFSSLGRPVKKQSKSFARPIRLAVDSLRDELEKDEELKKQPSLSQGIQGVVKPSEEAYKAPPTAGEDDEENYPEDYGLRTPVKDAGDRELLEQSLQAKQDKDILTAAKAVAIELQKYCEQEAKLAQDRFLELEKVLVKAPDSLKRFAGSAAPGSTSAEAGQVSRFDQAANLLLETQKTWVILVSEKQKQANLYQQLFGKLRLPEFRLPVGLESWITGETPLVIERKRKQRFQDIRKRFWDSKDLTRDERRQFTNELQKHVSGMSEDALDSLFNKHDKTNTLIKAYRNHAGFKEKFDSILRSLFVNNKSLQIMERVPEELKGEAIQKLQELVVEHNKTANERYRIKCSPDALSMVLMEFLENNHDEIARTLKKEYKAPKVATLIEQLKTVKSALRTLKAQTAPETKPAGKPSDLDTRVMQKKLDQLLDIVERNSKEIYTGVEKIIELSYSDDFLPALQHLGNRWIKEHPEGSKKQWMALETTREGDGERLLICFDEQTGIAAEVLRTLAEFAKFGSADMKRGILDLSELMKVDTKAIETLKEKVDLARPGEVKETPATKKEEAPELPELIRDSEKTPLAKDDKATLWKTGKPADPKADPGTQVVVIGPKVEEKDGKKVLLIAVAAGDVQELVSQEDVDNQKPYLLKTPVVEEPKPEKEEPKAEEIPSEPLPDEGVKDTETPGDEGTPPEEPAPEPPTEEPKPAETDLGKTLNFGADLAVRIIQLANLLPAKELTKETQQQRFDGYAGLLRLLPTLKEYCESLEKHTEPSAAPATPPTTANIKGWTRYAAFFVPKFSPKDVQQWAKNIAGNLKDLQTADQESFPGQFAGLKEALSPLKINSLFRTPADFDPYDKVQVEGLLKQIAEEYKVTDTGAKKEDEVETKAKEEIEEADKEEKARKELLPDEVWTELSKQIEEATEGLYDPSTEAHAFVKSGKYKEFLEACPREIPRRIAEDIIRTAKESLEAFAAKIGLSLETLLEQMEKDPVASKHSALTAAGGFTIKNGKIVPTPAAIGSGLYSIAKLFDPKLGYTNSKYAVSKSTLQEKLNKDLKLLSSKVDVVDAPEAGKAWLTWKESASKGDLTSTTPEPPASVEPKPGPPLRGVEKEPDAIARERKSGIDIRRANRLIALRNIQQTLPHAGRQD